MREKPKFRPVITRVKLNPEQAVLTCNCFDAGEVAVEPYEMELWTSLRCNPGDRGLFRWAFTHLQQAVS